MASSTNENIEKLSKDRYYLKNENSWDDIAKRVSDIHPPIYKYISGKYFIPSSPTLMNANTNGERVGTLSSCFPMKITDSIKGIYGALAEAAEVTKMGGGIGYDFSGLRSSNEVVSKINRNSSGPLPFIGDFNSMLDSIQQGGVRRGAGMALLSIYHPNILQFIRAKEDLTKYNRFNFSIKISTSFYKKLETEPNSIHRVKNVVTGEELDLMDEGKPVTVKELWDLIIHHAWKTAEPGIFNETIAFDRCTTTNVDSTVICNPCSEFVNIPFSSCNLGSINLSLLWSSTGFMWGEFREIVKQATIFLDNVIDKNNYPLEEIKNATLKIRPIGLGIMGLAHLLYKLGMPYDSPKALMFVDSLMYEMTINSMMTSIAMCRDGKKPYAAFDLELFKKANNRFWRGVKEDNLIKLFEALKTHGIRNSCFTSIAPTGSISYLANTSGGIEPVFALAYARKIEKLDHQYDVVYLTDPIFEEYLNNHYADKKTEILKEVTDNKGSCQKSKYLTDDEKAIFKVAADLTPEEHLKMLSVVANNTSLSVSKTINLPKETKPEEISNVFLKAHNMGIIGVTVYRDGCRDGILISDLKKKEDNFIERKEAPDRPIDLTCDIWDITVDYKRYIVSVGLLHGQVYEMFVTADPDKKIDLHKHKTGIIRKVKSKVYSLIVENGEETTLIEDLGKTFDTLDIGLSRMVSLALRTGAPLPEICKQLENSINFFGFKKSVMRILKKYIVDGERVIGELCEQCKTELIYAEGCKKCPSCGWSKCN